MSTPELSFAHCFLPSDNPGSSPTLLLLHGTGGSEHDLLSMGAALLPGAALLSPRGQVLENGMPRFFRRLAEGVFDIEDLQARTHQLADFVTSAASAYSFDPSKVLAVGYSNGANIAASLLLRRPQVLAGAVLLHPMVPLVPEPLPDLAGKPIFIGAGRRDPMVAQAQTQDLAALLGSAGAQVSLHWQDNGHSITQDELNAARSWLGQAARTLWPSST